MAIILQHFFKHVWQKSKCLLLILLLPVQVFAQKDTTKKLQEVKVSSSIPKLQGVTPSQSISSNDFDRYSALTVADAIRYFAGVNVKDYGGIGGIKTVSVRGFGANHTAILYDGVEINDAENGQIDLGKLNLNGVQQITLYNAQPDNILTPAKSFASASVIAIKTIQPNLAADKPYQVLLGLNGGSFGLLNPYLQWQQRLSNTWSFVVNSYLENANGHYKYKTAGDGTDTTQTRTNTDVSEQEVDGALYWAKNDSNKFNLHINYYNSDRGLPGAVVYYNPYSDERLWNRDFFLQSGYEHTWDDGLHLLLNTKLSQEYTHYTDKNYLNNSGGINDQYTQREAYQSVALAYHITSNWETSYAADISFSKLDANLYNYAYPTRFTLLNALASKLTLNRWLFQGNLLNTYVTEQVKTGKPTPSETVFSPTLMVSFQPFSPNLQFRTFYKDSFREPTFDEQYYFAINNISRNIKPEYARQYDLGITYRKAFNNWLDYVSFSVDGYYNTVTNKIIAIPNQNPVISSIINLGKVRIEGTDVSLKTQTKISNGWREVLSVNYTYQYAIDVTNPNDSYYKQQIPYTPKNTLALNAGVDYNQMGLYYNQVLSSSRYFLSNSNSANYIDGYGTGDLSFIYKLTIANKSTVFSAHADNLFNENYMIVRSFPMPGRSFLLSFQITI
ncbi:Outer membrane cobalamin receptor protein [Mucilaginibacter mallensis]|uniref:Outer membrane cobalamin receptor protein n=1 Tax=Mucilaginibacter mallensis TaxID=652787 RepID=A0A1H1WA67_MUCMA|nr:TonB-dependent receptor [Mucilaginibacter mallensis]SDS93993.1 Outer membrane cobalamin receptor protein [Mucilaginibacter mallensis]